MSKSMKNAIVDQMTRMVGQNESVVLVSTGRLTVADAESLRAKLRSEKMRMLFLKNSLATVAFEKLGFKGLGSILKGPSGVVYGGEGASSVAKILLEEAKKKKELTIVGAYFEGQVLDKKGVEALSKMPGKKELQAMVLQHFFAPVSEMAQSMDGLLSEVHGLIEALEKKGGAGAAS